MDTGERVWWVSGLAFEMKAVPVLSPDSATVYINGTSASAFEDSYDRAIPAYEDVASSDLDGDGRFQPGEIPDELARRWIRLIDLDGDGSLDRQEWEWYRSARASRGGINAFRTGGVEDMTASSFLWNHDRSVPQLPSALLYEGVLYMVDDGGIVTLLDPENGDVLDRGRLTEALDKYFASPVAGDGKVFMVSEACKVTVLEPGRHLEVLGGQRPGWRVLRHTGHRRRQDLRANAHRPPRVHVGRHRRTAIGPFPSAAPAWSCKGNPSHAVRLIAPPACTGGRERGSLTRRRPLRKRSARVGGCGRCPFVE